MTPSEQSESLKAAGTIPDRRRRVVVELRLAAVESRDENNLIPVLQLVLEFALELPVRIVDENENPRSPERQFQPSNEANSHSLAVDEHFLTLADQIVLHPGDEEAHVRRPSIGSSLRDVDGVFGLLGEDEVQATAVLSALKALL